MMNQKTLTYAVVSSLTLGTLCFAGHAAAAGESVSGDLGETVVTAERIPSRRLDTPADVTVITAREIEARHYTDFAEALQHVYGTVMTNGANGADQTVRIDGEERVVVMVDGERINDEQGSMSRASATLTRIPSLKDVERIEIVRGGGSALYGSDAVGGVINIITKKVRENRTVVDLSTGSWGTHAYEVATQGRSDRFSWSATAALQKRGYFYYKDRQGNSVRMPDSDYSNDGASLNLVQRLDDAQSLALRYSHRTMDGSQPAYRRSGVFQSTRQDEIFNDVSLTYRFREDTSLPGYLRYFNHYKSVFFSGKFHTRLQGVDYQDGWAPSANQKIIAGAEWHQSNSSNRQSGYTDRETANTAVYLQDTIKLAPKWIAVPGVRMDHHTAFGTHWSPKAAVNYRPDPATKVYASWGRVFKAPTADDLYYQVDYGAWGSYKGNPDLKPESGHTEQIGLTRDMGRDATLDVRLFRSILHDAIDWHSADGMNWTVSNIAREKKRGLSLSWKQKLSPFWSYDLAYSYTHTETNDLHNASVSQYLKANSQPNGYRAGIHYRQGAWTADLDGRMGTGLDREAYGMRRYVLLDFYTSYAWNPQLTIYAKALNFTNQAWSRYSGWKYPGTGRFFQFGLTYSF